jgi:23S rRNA (uridine2552-2'-O)-methyltransferase
VAQKRKLHDQYFRKAKAEGYAARSAYKLQEVQERYGILKYGDRVIDVGCAPGSWLQVASEIVGEKGRVVGIDLQPVTVSGMANVKTIVGDATKVSAEELGNLLGGSCHVLLSDMAPNTTGDPTGDHFRSVTLCRVVLDIAAKLLKPGGHLVMKVFEGETYGEFLRETQQHFAMVKGLKPDATRGVSREMFIIGMKHKPRFAETEVTEEEQAQIRKAQQVAPKRPPVPTGWSSKTVADAAVDVSTRPIATTEIRSARGVGQEPAMHFDNEPRGSGVKKIGNGKKRANKKKTGGSKSGGTKKKFNRKGRA